MLYAHINSKESELVEVEQTTGSSDAGGTWRVGDEWMMSNARIMKKRIALIIIDNTRIMIRATMHLCTRGGSLKCGTGQDSSGQTRVKRGRNGADYDDTHRKWMGARGLR